MKWFKFGYSKWTWILIAFSWIIVTGILKDVFLTGYLTSATIFTYFTDIYFQWIKKTAPKSYEKLCTDLEKWTQNNG
jgi:hypothetical protein